jgi:hypothetical protein
MFREHIVKGKEKDHSWSSRMGPHFWAPPYASGRPRQETRRARPKSNYDSMNLADLIYPRVRYQICAYAIRARLESTAVSWQAPWCRRSLRATIPDSIVPRYSKFSALCCAEGEAEYARTQTWMIVQRQVRAGFLLALRLSKSLHCGTYLLPDGEGACSFCKSGLRNTRSGGVQTFSTRGLLRIKNGQIRLTYPSSCWCVLGGVEIH